MKDLKRSRSWILVSLLSDHGIFSTLRNSGLEGTNLASRTSVARRHFLQEVINW